MTSAIELCSVPAQRLLVKKTTCPHTGIGPAFGKAIRAVEACMKAGGGRMASAPLAVYLGWRENDCDLAAGCIVEGNVELTEGCEWLEMAPSEAAMAVHLGPYSGLRETHDAVKAWIPANGKRFAGPCWEVYPTDPEREPDTSKWRTDVYYPVA